MAFDNLAVSWKVPEKPREKKKQSRIGWAKGVCLEDQPGGSPPRADPAMLRMDRPLSSRQLWASALLSTVIGGCLGLAGIQSRQWLPPGEPGRDAPHPT